MARSTSEDEDDISLASTTWTEDRSNYSPRDFNVERILAEHEEAGQLKYLIKWENYNVDRASFEPADEIPDFHVQRWEEKKVRIENGIDTALDVAAWVDNVARIKQEKNDRRQRRKAKRARIAARANIQWPRKAIPEPSSRDSDDEPLIVGRRQGLGATLPTTSNDASRNEKVPAKETYSKPKVTTTVPTKAPSKIFANWTNPRERKKRRGSESANPENIMTKEGRTRRFNTLAEQHRIRNAGANERPPQPGYEKHHQFDPETGDYRRISEPHIDTPSHLSGGMAQVARQSSGSVTAAEATLPRRVTLDTALDQSPPRESVAQQPQRAVSSLQTNIPEVTPEPVERMNLTDPERKVPLTCPSWKSDGNCRDGEDCPFLHRDSAYVASYNLQAEARRWSPKFGRPLVSAPLTCGYWYMNGFCKLSVDGCMFAHWNTGKLTGFGGRPPQAIPWERDGAISELALKQIKTCFFWAIGKCIKPAEECQFAHRLLDQIAHPPAGWPGEVPTIEEVRVRLQRRSQAPEDASIESFQLQLRLPMQFTTNAVQLEGLNAQTRALLTATVGSNPVLEVKYACLVDSFKRFHYQTENIAGNIVPVDTTSRNALDAYSSNLNLHDSGSLFLHQSFAILLYPARQERWNYLKPTQPSSHALRFYLCPPLAAPFRADPDNPNSVLSLNESHVESVLRVLFNFDKDTISTLFYWPTLPMTSRRVFLLYDNERFAGEIDLLTKFFHAKSVKVYHAHVKGSWKRWKKNIGDHKGGAVIVHPTFYAWDELPELAWLLNSKCNFFNLGSFDFSTKRVYNDFKPVKLFPDGTVAFVTDEVFEHYPDDALKIVNHIHEKVKKKAWGQKNWKLAGRPGLLTWLLNLRDEYGDNIRAGSEQSRVELAAIVRNFLCPPEQEDRTLDTFERDPGEHAALISAPAVLKPEHAPLWKSDPVEATRKIVWWFAGKMLTYEYKIRRFVIVVHEVGAEEQQWKQEYKHVDVITVAKYLERYC